MVNRRACQPLRVVVDLPIKGNIRVNENGAPHYKLTGAAAEKLRAMGGGMIYLSLTHEGGMAAAVAIIERA